MMLTDIACPPWIFARIPSITKPFRIITGAAIYYFVENFAQTADFGYESSITIKSTQRRFDF